MSDWPTPTNMSPGEMARRRQLLAAHAMGDNYGVTPRTLAAWDFASRALRRQEALRESRTRAALEARPQAPTDMLPVEQPFTDPRPTRTVLPRASFSLFDPPTSQLENEATRTRLARLILRGQQPDASLQEQHEAALAMPHYRRLVANERAQGRAEIVPQSRRGLAETGYRTLLGINRLRPDSEARRAVESELQSGRDEMRRVYGDPQTRTGLLLNIGSDIVGTVAQAAAAGLGGAQATLPITAPNAVRAGVAALAQTPFDAIQGAGAEPETSTLGLFSQRLAQSPVARAVTDAIPGAALGLGSRAVRQGLRTAQHAMRTEFMPVSPEEFDRAVQAFAQRQPDERGFLTMRTPEQMQAEGMQTYLNPRGEAGYAVAPDGDVRNVFASRGRVAPSTGAAAVIDAVQRGGTKLDVFDVPSAAGQVNRPSQVYRNLGFRETSRLPWSDEYMPEGWNLQKYGRPDVSFMALPEVSRADPRTMWDNFRFWMERQGNPRAPMPFTVSERLNGALRGLYGRLVTAGIDPTTFGANFGQVLSGNAPDALRAMRVLTPYLTDEERQYFTNARTLPQLMKTLDIFDRLPSEFTLASAAIEGRSARGWYRNSAQALSDTFGPDAPRFTALLASMSPRTSVPINMRNSLAVWQRWVADGRPHDAASINRILRETLGDASAEGMRSWTNNVHRVLTQTDPSGFELSGPKVRAFYRNLLGETEAVTLDTWMQRVSGIEENILGNPRVLHTRSGTVDAAGPGYMGYAARVRETARKLTQLTGETWTPAETQETIWSWARALGEDAGGVVENVSPDMVASQENFYALLHHPDNASVLTQMGLPVPTPQPRQQMVGSIEGHMRRSPYAGPGFVDDTQGGWITRNGWMRHAYGPETDEAGHYNSLPGGASYEDAFDEGLVRWRLDQDADGSWTPVFDLNRRPSEQQRATMERILNEGRRRTRQEGLPASASRMYMEAPGSTLDDLQQLPVRRVPRLMDTMFPNAILNDETDAQSRERYLEQLRRNIERSYRKKAR